MRSKPPAFQFYVRQWMGDKAVLSMDWDAQAMHLWLMCIAWQSTPQGCIPNEEQVIRYWLKKPKEKTWQRVWPQIKRGWKIKGNFLTQMGLIREWKKQKKWRDKSKEGGKRSAESRAKSRKTGTQGWLTKCLPNGSNQMATLQSSSSSSSADVPLKPPLNGQPALASPNGNGAVMDWAMLLSLWNDCRGKLPAVTTWTQDREELAIQRWHENPNVDYWTKVVKRLAKSRMATPHHQSGFVATFDWLLKDATNHVKVAEGQYDYPATAQSLPPPPVEREIPDSERLSEEEMDRIKQTNMRPRSVTNGP